MDWLKLLKHSIQLAQELSLADWLTLVEAWWNLLFFRLAFLVMSYNRLDDPACAADPSARRGSRAPVYADAKRLHRLVHFAGQLHLIPMTCLVRSLTLKKMLDRRSIPAQIRIGARRDQGTLYAHAWVEVDHTPIGEAQDVTAKFNPFAFVNLNNRKFM
jgi:hypothetical protein